jgi:hypothetical protein
MNKNKIKNVLIVIFNFVFVHFFIKISSIYIYISSTYIYILNYKMSEFLINDIIILLIILSVIYKIWENNKNGRIIMI